jgi:hypothetical protein
MAEMAREAVLTSDKDVKQIVKFRDNDGLHWAEIAEKFGVSQGKVMFAYMVGTVDKVANPTAKKIADLRSKGESWGMIAARTGMSEGAARKLFEEATGSSALGQRIGKGGRHPGSSNGNGSAPAPAKRAAKAAKDSAAPATKGGGKLRDLVVSGKATLEQVQKGLTGKQVKVTRSGKDEVIGVAEVTGLKGQVITVKDNDTGRSRAIKAETITGVR